MDEQNSEPIFDAHRVFFWSMFGIAVSYLTIAACNGGKLGGIFDAKERQAAVSYLNRNYPDFAKTVGLSRR